MRSAEARAATHATTRVLTRRPRCIRGAGIGALKKRHEEKQLGVDVDEYLPPGSSAVVAVVAVVDDRWADKVENALVKSNKRINKAIDSDDYDELQKAISKCLLARLIFVGVSTEEAPNPVRFVLGSSDWSQHRHQLLHRVSEAVYGGPQWIDRRRERVDDFDLVLDRGGGVLDRVDGVSDLA